MSIIELSRLSNKSIRILTQYTKYYIFFMNDYNLLFNYRMYNFQSSFAQVDNLPNITHIAETRESENLSPVPQLFWKTEVPQIDNCDFACLFL